MNDYIQDMIDWIEENLLATISLDKLSVHMGFSPYYCSFKFHQSTGMSIRQYTLLRRLYLSTKKLENGRKIIDVAFDYDYSSQEAYSRAFKSVFGITPKMYQQQRVPIQTVFKLTINKEGEGYQMDISKKIESDQLPTLKQAFLNQNVLNVLNGQHMYKVFKDKQLMGSADYVPFNEAMSVHETTEIIFSETFIELRSSGHYDTKENYRKKVIAPLNCLFTKSYNCLVLWFGEDMFCQMNLLTMLAYLEQSDYNGEVFLNSFREDEFKVNQTKLKLGNYLSVYKEVLLNHQKPSSELLPVMFQAVNLYLDMLNEHNEVTKYIYKNKNLSTDELLNNLLRLFPRIGYGDSQYLELINKCL
ncbi:Right origin-binding protein [Listeria grayi]|uniref:ABC transporter ATP-binding protein n=1 Tax=Listeria grayi FSL F6-1183 TaxID=1265827 RepID=A0A829R8I2_LISGR|nr:AraC family transcriptional regulator [Listeria grayi]EUJ29884.1 ABC transporter ATP-binding protein [Listeria grayi FSL F6-1183]VEI34254.1 Right origin-binding protein [Listeria grayi]